MKKVVTSRPKLKECGRVFLSKRNDHRWKQKAAGKNEEHWKGEIHEYINIDKTKQHYFWKHKNNNAFIVQFNYFVHRHTDVYICVYVQYIYRYIITMCVPKICSSYSGCITNYLKTLGLKMITIHVLLTIWAGDGRDNLSLCKVASAWVAQSLGTRIIWKLAPMSYSWCWLLAETFAGAVDGTNFTSYGNRVPKGAAKHTYAHMELMEDYSRQAQVCPEVGNI